MKKNAILWAAIILMVILGVWLWLSNQTDIFTREDDIAATGDLAERQIRSVLQQVQRFAVLNERLPETLTILVNEGFLDTEAIDDPFEPGKEIRYRGVEDGRFLLWSVGPDGRDDGGEPNLYGKRVTPNSEGDIALEGTFEHLLNREK